MKHTLPKRRVKRKVIKRRILSVTIVFTVIIVASLCYYFTYSPRESSRRAVIYDSLHKFIPNDRLLKQLKFLLNSSGYEVDVFVDNNATVENFRKIIDYDLIIIRAHGGFLPKGIEIMNYYLKDHMAFIFTGELYDPGKYVLEQRALKIMIGKFRHENGSYTEVFAVSPLFILGLNGAFRKGSVVIIASCYGLTGEALAKSFLTKGASVYIAWPGDVTTEHMDKALYMLLEKVLRDNMSWVEAVKYVNETLGPDPYYNSFLDYRVKE